MRTMVQLLLGVLLATTAIGLQGEASTPVLAHTVTEGARDKEVRRELAWKQIEQEVDTLLARGATAVGLQGEASKRDDYWHVEFQAKSYRLYFPEDGERLGALLARLPRPLVSPA